MPSIAPLFLHHKIGNKYSKLFENTILILIVLSSISLAFDNPLSDPNSFFK
jgi:hypothetical protein